MGHPYLQDFLGRFLGARQETIALVSGPANRNQPEKLFVFEGRARHRKRKLLLAIVTVGRKLYARDIRRILARAEAYAPEQVIVCSRTGFALEAILECRKSSMIAIKVRRGSRGLEFNRVDVVLGKFFSVESWMLSLNLPDSGANPRTFEESTECLSFQGKPLRNWLYGESRRLLQQTRQDGTWTVTYRLKRPHLFRCRGEQLLTKTLQARITCRIRFKARMTESVLRRGRLGPPSQSEDWHEIDEETFPRGLKIATALIFYHPIRTSRLPGVPKMSRVITGKSSRFR